MWQMLLPPQWHTRGMLHSRRLCGEAFARCIFLLASQQNAGENALRRGGKRLQRYRHRIYHPWKAMRQRQQIQSFFSACRTVVVEVTTGSHAKWKMPGAQNFLRAKVQ